MESLMNPTVLTRTMVVKNEGDDRCPHLGHAPVMSLADRFRQIKSRLEATEGRRVSEREISRRCGLEETHFTKILKRLDSNPNADIEQETLHKIAVGTNTSVQWLLSGEGPESASETVFVPDERYPNRAQVLAMFQKVDPRARKWLASMELSGTDMRPEEWAKLLFNKEAEFQLMDRDPAAAQAEVQKRRDAAMALADADAAALERKRAELKARKARGG